MASKKELEALIVLAGKIDPSLQKSINEYNKKQNSINKNAEKHGKSSVNMFKKVGGAAVMMGGAIVTSIAAGAAALSGIAVKSANTADQLVKMRDQTGLTAETLQKMQYISEQLGGNFESLPKSVGKLTQTMAAAKAGNKDAILTFRQMKISFKDATGALRPQNEVFEETLVQLSKMENIAERNALAYKLFGKGAADLFPILNAGTPELQRLSQEAVKLGLVIQEDTVSALDEFGDTLAKLKGSMKSGAMSLLAGMLPKIQPLINKMVDKLPQLAESAGGYLGEFLSQVVDLLPPLMQLGSDVMPVILQILSGIMPIIIQLLPILVGIVQAALPPLLGLLNVLLPILKDLMSIITFLAKLFGAVLVGAIQYVTYVIKGLYDVIKPVIDLISDLVVWIERLDDSGGKKIAINSTVTQKNQSVATGLRMSRYASGGFANKPSIFGEAGREVAIPIRYKSPRSLQLHKQAGKEIGASDGNGDSYQFIFNPMIMGGSGGSIQAELQEGFEQFKAWVEDYFESKRRESFA